MPSTSTSTVNPQRENGHVDIANEIVDYFIGHRLSGEEWQILWLILRKTWGWRKKTDKIKTDVIAKSTGIHKPNVVRAVNNLIAKNILKKEKTHPPTYSFNKHYDTWLLPTRKKFVLNKENNYILNKENVPERTENNTVSNVLNKENKLNVLNKENKLFSIKRTHILNNENVQHATPATQKALAVPKDTRKDKDLIDLVKTTSGVLNKENELTKPQNIQPHQLLVDKFKQLYEKKFKVVYVESEKDFILFVKILKKVSLEEILKRISNAFEYEYWFEIRSITQLTAHFNDLGTPPIESSRGRKPKKTMIQHGEELDHERDYIR